jgi:hypothetical protein
MFFKENRQYRLDVWISLEVLRKVMGKVVYFTQS